MENNIKPRTRSNNILLMSIVALGSLLLIALTVMFLNINKVSKLSQEKVNLEKNIASLNDQVEIEINETNKQKEIIITLNDSLTNIVAANKEALRIKDVQIHSLRNKEKRMIDLQRELVELRKIEVEHERLQVRFDKLLAETLRKKKSVENLSEELKVLRDSVNSARYLVAHNITSLNKWNRWLWSDRYNVSVARRVNETHITFEIAGTPFTKQGTKVVYLNMVDPNGNLLYPIGDGFEYTAMEEINYTGNYIPLNFVVEHPEKLVPGTYSIQVYIDNELVRESEIDLE
ncbi:MAG: hypothetical protein WCR61_06975 [Bacteroidales bacterium]|nr:hypothetical protein [Bacteroidales bacterium]MDD4657076.1 hypothetical protein [Bacteroidales bacterium]